MGPVASSGLAGSEPVVQRSRAKKDRGDISMLLGDIEWKGTSARAQVKKKTGTLKIEGSRMDGSPQTSMVRQSIVLYLPEYAGPGTYNAKIGSMFLVVGVKADAEANPEVDAAVVEALAKAKHLQLEGAEVVVESASDTEVVGSFSFDRGRTAVTNGRFRALFRKK